MGIFFFRILSHFYVVSMFLMRRLHLARSCASSPDNSLRQVVPGVVQPPPLRSSSLSFPRHLRHHHSLPYVFVFYSQYMPIPLQSTFLHFLGYFSHLRRPSNSFIPNSVQLGDSTHPPRHVSSFPHPTSSLVLSSLPIAGLTSYNCLVIFPLDSQTYSSLAQNP